MEVLSNNGSPKVVNVPLTDCFAQLVFREGEEAEVSDFRIWANGVAYGTLTLDRFQAKEMSDMFLFFANSEVK